MKARDSDEDVGRAKVLLVSFFKGAVLDTRYIVGIDLGTTNSALGQFDGAAPEAEAHIEVRSIPQLVNPGEVDERRLLPSFLFIPGEFDFPKGSLTLPWDRDPQFVIGELAQRRGAENPARLVASAKSWLSYAAVNRSSPILPWQAPEEVPKLSPVEVSSRYLQYLRSVWDSQVSKKNPELALSEQEILLTVPASFDEEARELTLRAAEQAGLKYVTLLEEPQAAFYAWLESQGEGWRNHVKIGDLILVCDVGGGTTDFSLIAVSEESGDLALRRVAVGDHILLGGDNMDLALARLLQQKLEADGHRIDMGQLHALWHQARMAKERFFNDPKIKKQPITLLGKGTKLVGGTIKSELLREEVEQALVEGFFPIVASGEMPVRRHRIGFQELGLPYAADPAITKHLARFLAQQVTHSPEAPAFRRGPSGFACPTRILFNGGVMKSSLLRERIVEVLNAWLRGEGLEPLSAKDVLDAPDLDHAVARGAAFPARRGAGAGCASAVALRALTTSASRAPCPPCPACPPRSRRSASSLSGWKKGRKQKSPAANSGWWSASRRSSASSAPPHASRIKLAAWSKTGATRFRSSARWK